MANYGFITVDPIDFESDLRGAVTRALDDRWVVSKANFEDGGPVWLVELPGTAVADEDLAMSRWLPPGEDVGFAVALQPGQVAFRHSSNRFERWAQGCIEEELADLYSVGVLYDATDETMPPGTRRYRVGKTFRDFLMHHLKRCAEDEAYIERWKTITPEGHW